MSRFKIFVINLKRDEKRRKFISDQLYKLNLEFSIIDAIDGKEITSNEFEKLVDEVAIYDKRSWLTNGAIGCALSHHKAYTIVAKENLDYALIIEDDCILSSDLPTIIKQLPDHLKDGEIVLLYYRNWTRIKLHKQTALSNGYLICTPDFPDKVGSTVAYIVTKQASINLANNLMPIRTSSDHWGYFIQHQFIERIRCIYPMPVDTADFKSSIDYLPEGSLISALSKLIDNYRVFPFYQLLMYRRRRIKNKLEIRDLIE